MNIDFSAHPGFSWYVLLLMFSGVVMLGLATTRTTTGLRVVNGLFGAGFVGYGFYLAFLFHGGSYLIFFKAFILPVVLIARSLRARAATPPVAPPAYVPPPPSAWAPSPWDPSVPQPTAPASYSPPTYAPPSYAPPSYAPPAQGFPPPPAAYPVYEPPHPVE